MASSHHGDNEHLPITWPFRAAGTLMVLATIWFCTGWGIRDLPGEQRLSQHMPVFWTAIVLVIVLCVVGGLMNLGQARKRAAAQAH